MDAGDLTTMKPFALELVESGEALAYLHLSGAAVNRDDTSLTYTTAIEEREVTFQYEVLCICNGDTDRLGKAVVYQPSHDPDRIIVAFRAVRIDSDWSTSPSGNKADVESMLDTKFHKTSWLPSKTSQMSFGVARHAGGIWAGGVRGGLSEFLKTTKAREVHFTGLSLAGALAQAVALRSVFEKALPNFHERACVFTFGAVPWINDIGAACYADILGERTVHLCTRMTVHANVLPVSCPAWWEAAVGAAYELDARDVGESSRPFIVADPITSAFAEEHAVMCNTFAIESTRGAPAAKWCNTDDDEVDFWRSGARCSAVTRFPPHLVPRTGIHDLMNHKLPPHDALVRDYMRLHRGRAYKAAVRALVHCAIEARRARDLEATETPTFTAAESPSISVTASAMPKLPRNSSSKRRLADLDEENATDAGNAFEISAELLSEGTRRMNKIASYGSLGRGLDELSMC